MRAKMCLLVGVLAGTSMAAAQVTGAVASAPAQAAVASANGYTVTGRVICGDTQRPARFAQVTLLPATEGNGDDFGGRGRPVSARTDLDGNFSVNDVPVGDYFVTGSLSGYINATSAIRAALSAGTDPSAAVPGVPQVNVGAGGASVALTLQRGGVIAGTVQWDDGSPAGGVQVIAQVAPSSATTGGSGAASTSAAQGLGRPAGFGGGSLVGSQSDDRGRFRLTGLTPGTYLVRAAVQVPLPARGEERGFSRTFNLYVYAPDKQRRTDATATTVSGAEEHDDVAITLGLAGLHSVSGTVSSTGAAVRSGSLSLTDQTDSTLSRQGVIGSDGSFTVPDVPPGNYTLNVSASSQPSGNGRGGSVQTSGNVTRFQPLQESVTVTDSDLTGLSLNVAPAAGTQ